MHLSEVLNDVKYTEERYGLKPVELLEEVGILKTKCILAHGVWLTQREIHMLKGRNVSLVLNPTTNILLRSGIPPILELVKSKVNLALGLDLNPKLNLLEEMFTLKMMCKTIGLPMEVDSYELLKMVTLNAAKALGFDKRIGVIDKGMYATLTVLNFNAPEHWPPKAKSIYDAIVYGRPKVETVIVDGEVLVDGGEVLTISDYDVEKGLKYAEELLIDLIDSKC